MQGFGGNVRSITTNVEPATRKGVAILIGLS